MCINCPENVIFMAFDYDVIPNRGTTSYVRHTLTRFEVQKPYGSGEFVTSFFFFLAKWSKIQIPVSNMQRRDHKNKRLTLRLFAARACWHDVRIVSAYGASSKIHSVAIALSAMEAGLQSDSSFMPSEEKSNTNCKWMYQLVYVNSI